MKKLHIYNYLFNHTSFVCAIIKLLTCQMIVYYGSPPIIIYNTQFLYGFILYS